MAKQMEQQQTGGPGYDIPCYGLPISPPSYSGRSGGPGYDIPCYDLPMSPPSYSGRRSGPGYDIPWYDLPMSPPSYSGRSGGPGYDIPCSPPQYSGSHYYRAKPFVPHYSGGDGTALSPQQQTGGPGYDIPCFCKCNTVALTTALATGGTVPSATSVGGAFASSAVAAASAEISTAEPASSDTVPSAASIRGAVGARESSAGAVSSDAATEAARRPAVLLPLLRRRRGRLERLRQQLGPLAKSAARGGRPPTPSIPVPCVRWRSTTTTAAGCSMTVAVAAAAAVETTIPTTTTHGGMQPVLEHCCDPLIRESDAGGVRGEGRRF